MSKSEDYLDGLLNMVEQGKVPRPSWEEELLAAEEEERARLKEKPKKGDGDDFFDSFEKELLVGESTDDFLRQFEEELRQERKGSGIAGQEGTAGALGNGASGASIAEKGGTPGDGAGPGSPGDIGQGGTPGVLDVNAPGTGSPGGIGSDGAVWAPGNGMPGASGAAGMASGAIGDSSIGISSPGGGMPGASGAAGTASGAIGDSSFGTSSFGGGVPGFGSSGADMGFPGDGAAGEGGFPENGLDGLTMESEEGLPESSGMDPLPEDLDELVNSVKERMQDIDGEAFPDGPMDVMVDTLGDLPEAGGAQANSSDDTAAGLEDGSEDLMDLLSSDGDSDLGGMLGEGGMPGNPGTLGPDGLLEDSGIDMFSGLDADGKTGLSLEDLADEGMEKEKKGRKKKKSHSGKGGFAQKLAKLFFGAEEKEDAVPITLSDMAAMGVEGIEPLSGMEESSAQAAEDAQASEKKKKEEQKEKKAAAKKEKKEKKAKKAAAKKAKKEKKPKKAKKQKPKREKKPKVRDNTPPLPKVPVILIFIMVGSFLALVLVGTNLVGYSNSYAEAEKDYGLGNYEAAYLSISGLETAEEDEVTYGKYRIMANAAGEYSAYQSFMEARLYDMALDSLVRAVGRCGKYSADAAAYGCDGELERIKEQASGALSSFGITEEQALELYSYEDRGDYSKELYRILDRAGLLEQMGE